MIREINIGDKKILYEITRKKVKNINMRISADSVVKVSASSRVSIAEIEKAILKNSEFIFRAQDKYRKAKENSPAPLKYENRETIKILGKKYTLMVTKGENNALLTDDIFHLTAADTDDFFLKEKITDAFLRQLISEKIRIWLDEIFPQFREYGIPYPQITFRKMKSRWGSCHIQKKKITFNTELIHKSEDFCRYVIIHELTHLIHPNHSKEFYYTVKLFMENYKEVIEKEKQI